MVMSPPATGSKSPTINDVAALAGVSKKTVSRVINQSELLRPATREKVERAIADLGFVPNPQARALAFRRNMMIALLHDNPNSQTVLNFERGVLSAIANSDLALAVRPVDRNSPDMLRDIEIFLVKQRPLGVLILPPISERDELAELCQRMGVRYVRAGSAPLDMAKRCIATDDRGTVELAVSELIRHGHTRIGFVRGPDGFRSASERELGFRAAMAAAGLEVDPAWTATGDYTFESGTAAGHALLSAEPRPTAIFASNDEMAAAIMHVAHENGMSLPRDLSVMGFDDSPTARAVWPSLSTIHWPVHEMAQIAVRKLVPDFLVDQPPAGDTVLLRCSLVERNSVAPPSAG